MIKDFYELFERFSIMTIDGGLSDDKAIERLKSKTTDLLYKQLIVKLHQLERK